MREHSRPPAEAATVFGEKLSVSLAENTFVRLVLSPRERGEGAAEKVTGRCIDLQQQPHFSLTFRYATRDEVHNLPVAQAVDWVLQRLGSEFSGALLSTTRNDWQFSSVVGKPARLIRHRPSTTTVPAREHDRRRTSLLDESARDWLAGLGITDSSGRVRPAMADKYTQINRYLEILSHLVRDCGWDKPATDGGPVDRLSVADMGCGKGYLTFGLWHLFRRVSGLPMDVIGIEARPELATAANQLARTIGVAGLQFVCGTIDSVKLPPLRGLIALHACNTATDDAILRGVRFGAELIVVAPCCHKQVRPQLSGPEALQPVLRHGIMAERMAEWATDGLRALFLEWAGYQAKIFEFVSSDHTPKNLMISAVRKPGDAFSDLAARRRIEEFKSFFHVQAHALDPLLSAP